MSHGHHDRADWQNEQRDLCDRLHRYLHPELYDSGPPYQWEGSDSMQVIDGLVAGGLAHRLHQRNGDNLSVADAVEVVRVEAVIEALRDGHRNGSCADQVEFVSELVGWSAEDDPELHRPKPRRPRIVTRSQIDAEGGRLDARHYVENEIGEPWPPDDPDHQEGNRGT